MTTAIQFQNGQNHAQLTSDNLKISKSFSNHLVSYRGWGNSQM